MDEQRLEFMLQVLLATSRSSGNSQVVYPLLQANLNKLDEEFAKLLRRWSKNILAEVDAQQAQSIAAAIGNFSSLIGQYPLGIQSTNLEIAIVGCEIVTSVFTCNAFPKDWAIAQLNLGNGYTNRIKGDKSENIEQAITAYQRALEVYTREAFPTDWAITQNNLAGAYTQRIRGERSENLEKAIAACNAASQILTQEAFPKHWAITQTTLGTAYCELGYPDRSENLERAITAYKAALEVFTQQRFREDWARTQNNLATAYNERIRGDRSENLALAIESYQNALQVYNCEDFPDEYAMAKNNLGNAYREQEQFASAIACYRAALEIHTPSSFPIESLRAGRNLGKIAFRAGLWSEAIEGFSVAIDAVEQSRTWARSETRRQDILAQSIGIYENMVQACINDGQLEKAIEYVERSRSKRLVDLMASNDLYQSGEIPPEVKELLQQYDNLQERIDRERSSYDADNNRELMRVGNSTRDRAAFQGYNEAIASLEAEKQQIWEQLRRLDPVLAGEIQVTPLKFADIQKLIDPPTTAILSFYTTSTDTHIFVLRQNKITLHTCTGQGLETLQNWIVQNWLMPYVSDRQTWKSQINTILSELSQRLQLPELISKHLEGIEELIIVPHLLLHQIPFAALPIVRENLTPPCPPSPLLAGDRSVSEELGERSKYLGDKFLIRYTPSCQILEFCHQRGNVETFNETSLQYGTVEDAEDNLPCASFEGEQIAQLCKIPQERRLIGSTQATCNNYRQLVQKIQVLHSCHHAQSRLDNPLESQLKLADGSITLGQLMTPGWRLPNLSDVFLSCCETNLGDPSITDDILTLSTGFLCAGARSVVSTLWAVDDLATAVFSIFYYQHRQHGKSRPEALQEAQIQLHQLKKDELLGREDVKELKKQAVVKFDEAKSKRKQYQRGSAEHLKWTREQIKYEKLKAQIDKLENSQQERPFSHPCYWAAFTCQGLR